MDLQHRKIELQSPSDLSYLTSRLRAAAIQKLDLHLPPVSSTSNEPDDLRRNVETLVDAFVAQVLQGMRQNISINGIDVVTEGNINDPGVGMDQGAESLVEKEEFEAFDEKLRSQLSAAVARRDALVAKISAHRRSTGKTAAEAFVQRWETDGAEVEAAWREMLQRVGVVNEADEVDVKALERQEEVERNWERAVQGLQRLNKGLPETRARLERAGDVLGYLEGQQGKGR
ncbi:hypothetical protein yc1106_07395 [Curvularia clavata]|uniref:Kinetochore protein mis14 n=1 Tax=Curvularia clavata TaxID=95742 RepID=A0A9Q9DW57_CURCL|nr:hypothetical protein yc1106_07395 [Curvularia clavata]